MASILSIDWFLDRCRTAVNVWGDAVGAAVVERWAPPLSLDSPYGPTGERQEAAGHGP
jgi:Na+/H+-dicarboxylate symporter